MGDGGTRIAVRDLAILQLKKRTACKCVCVCVGGGGGGGGGCPRALPRCWGVSNSITMVMEGGGTMYVLVYIRTTVKVCIWKESHRAFGAADVVSAISIIVVVKIATTVYRC